jgi:hypothetical protein
MVPSMSSPGQEPPHMQLSWQARPVSFMPCHAMPFHSISLSGSDPEEERPSCSTSPPQSNAPAPAPHLHPPDQTGVSESGLRMP